MKSRVWRLLLALVLLGTALVAVGASPVAAQAVEAPLGDCSETASSSEIGLYDDECYLYDIDKTQGYIDDGIDDAYDSFGDLEIDGVTYDTATDGVLGPDGRTVILPIQVMSGLNVHREVYVPATGGHYARWYNELHNPTGAPITVDVYLGGCSLGSDSSTVIQSTSSGDQIVSAADYWSVSTQDASPIFGDPVVGIVVDGMGGADRVETFFYEDGEDCVDIEWQNVTVQPGETLAYVAFTIQQESRADAQAEAQRLAEDPTAWSEGLTPEQIERVQNFLGLPTSFMHVASISLSLNRSTAACAPVGIPCIIAAVQIVDQDGAPVPGATVYGRFTYPSGKVVNTSGVTDANGMVQLKTRASERGRVRYWFEVTNVTKASDGSFVYVYDPSSNVETRDSIIY